MISTTPPSGRSLGATHSDLAFTGKYTIQGNYNGFEIYDISNPAKPVLAQTLPAARRRRTTCRSTRTCCSCRRKRPTAGPTAASAACRSRSARIACAASASSTSRTSKNPKLVTSVQTCRGSHTHTVVTQPGDNDNVYIYVSGTSGVRSADEVPGCTDGGDRRSEHRAVPPRSDQGAARGAGAGGDRQLAAHLQRLCRCRRAIRSATRRRGGRAAQRGRRTRRARRRRRAGAAAAAQGAAPGAAPAGRRGGRGGRAADRRPDPNQCHDITVYPGHRPRRRRVRRARAAARHPRSRASDPHRLRSADPNMSFWHSATFSNDGKQGAVHRRVGRRIGAALPRHRQAGVGRRRALHHREQQAGVPQLLQDAGARRPTQENCVAHNGSLDSDSRAVT